MDEPLSNLDAKLRVQMRTEITRLHKRLNTTFIYVTHDQTEAMTMGTRIVVMKDGFIQQVDTPQNLYDYPCNKFVAGFIGTPQMNFFDATLVKDGDKVIARMGENKIELPQGVVAKLTDQSYIGKDVILGIRPDDIHDEQIFIESHPEAQVKAHVELLEKLGYETLVYLEMDSFIQEQADNAVARVNPRSTIMAGDDVKLAFDPYRIHLFDKDTEVSILER
jgi:multiple sugar transport system ATP-binding protein